MRQREKNNNNSSNSLIFGRWPQTISSKIEQYAVEVFNPNMPKQQWSGSWSISLFYSTGRCDCQKCQRLDPASSGDGPGNRFDASRRRRRPQRRRPSRKFTGWFLVSSPSSNELFNPAVSQFSGQSYQVSVTSECGRFFGSIPQALKWPFIE